MPATIRSCFALCALAVCHAWIADSASAVVLGTFNSTRAGDANLINGIYSTQARAALATHFPQLTLSGLSSLTPAALSGVDALLIFNTSGVSTTTPLSPSEQITLANFVSSGKNAFVLADGFGLSTAQTFISPFTMVEASNPTVDTGPTINFASPITTGPFGVVNSLTTSFGGVFSFVGPYATPLIDAGDVAQPTFASIDKNVLSPGSGRVILGTDTTAFADPGPGGYFSTNETLFLNSIQWLLPVPEPAPICLASMALCALAAICRHMRRDRR